MASERMQRRIERLLDQADEAADRREWAEVQRLAEDILLIDSANADAEAFLELSKRGLEKPAKTASIPIEETSAHPAPPSE